MVEEGVYGSRTFGSEGVKSYYVSTVPGQVPDAWSGLELSWSRVIRHKMEEWYLATCCSAGSGRVRCSLFTLIDGVVGVRPPAAELRSLALKSGCAFSPPAVSSA